MLRSGLLVAEQLHIDQILNQLQKKYSSALYSYFRITNLPEAYESFKQNPELPPSFSYGKNINLNYVTKRLDKLSRDYAKYSSYSLEIKTFLDKRILETNILKLFLQLKDNPDKINEKRLASYIKLQENLYGSIDKILFEQIRNNLISTEKYANALYSPTKDTFNYYRRLYKTLFPELDLVLQNVSPDAIKDSNLLAKYFEQALRSIGAHKKGWLIDGSHGSHILVSKHLKKVIIGQHLRPITTLRLKQLLAHEVGTHVQRTLYELDDETMVQEEEGLAILAEQLTNRKFVHKRTLRYLAICYGFGIDGKPRNFNETFNKMYDTIILMGGNQKQIKRRAFNETARVFRGGLPDVPGFIYIKDKVYLESNLRVWQRLDKDLLSESKFKSLFRGKQPTFRGKKVLA